MMTLLLGAALGLLGPPGSDAISAMSRTCSYKGVFQLEVGSRYTMTLEQAAQACKSLDTTLATLEEVIDAYNYSLETCRYGWIKNGSAIILRHRQHPNCGSNQTGIIYTTDTMGSTYDAYCYNASDSSPLNCKMLVNPVSSSSEGHPAGDVNSTVVSTAAATTPPGSAEDDSDEGRTTAGPGAVSTVSDPNSAAEDVMTPEPSIPGTTSPTLTEGSTEGLSPSPPVKDQEEDGKPEAPHTYPTSLEPFEESNGSGSFQDVNEEDKVTVTAPPAEQGEVENAGGNPVTEESGPETDPEPKAPRSPKQGRKAAAEPAPTTPPQKHRSTPDWLIILTVVMAVAVLLLVFAAIATRNRWCGKQQTLMITKEGAEGNGAAAGARAEEREQEMVTLMHKESVQENGNKEEFTCIALEELPEKDQLA